MAYKSESAKMPYSADKAARTFVTRLLHSYTAAFRLTVFFFCFAPVRARVVSQAKPHALTRFQMSERPNEKSCDVSLILEYESGVFEAQHLLSSISSAKKTLNS